MVSDLTGRDLIVEVLLQHHADPASLNALDGFTPLMWACKGGHLKTVERLLAVQKTRTHSSSAPEGLNSFEMISPLFL